MPTEVDLPNWDDGYPDQKQLRHEVTCMAESFVETLLELIPKTRFGRSISRALRKSGGTRLLTTSLRRAISMCIPGSKKTTGGASKSARCSRR